MADGTYIFTINCALVDEDLLNFQAMVNLSDSFGITDLDASDIFNVLGEDKLKFKIEVAGAQCYVEIECWDSVNKKAILWVNIPIVSASENTQVCVSYDTAMADNTSYVAMTGQPASKSVWGSDYAAVYHMSQDPSGVGACILDSTTNEHHGTVYGSMTVDDLVDADFGKALNFDGSNYVNIGDILPFSTGFTWHVRVSSYSDVHGIFCKGAAAGTRELRLRKDTSTSMQVLFGNGSWTEVLYPAISLPTNSFCDIVAVWNGYDTLNIYLDGQLVYTNSVVDGPMSSAGSGFVFGTDFATNELVGKIAQLTLSHTIKSPVWAKVSYLSSVDELFLLVHNFSITQETPFLNLIIDYNKIDEDLTDFPVMVYLSSESSLGNVLTELETAENRYKIAVTTANGLTKCYVEIESWSVEDREATLYTKVPFISSTEDTVLYLYYDKNNFNNLYVGDAGSVVAQSVWDGDFVAVYHMAQDPSVGGACILDSTSNANHGTPNGSMASEDLVDAGFGKVLSFDGVDDYLNTACLTNFSTNDFSIEILCNPSSLPGNYFQLCGDADGKMFIGGRNNTVGIGRASVAWDQEYTCNLIVDSWNTIEYIRLSGTLSIKVNGVLIGSGANSIDYDLSGMQIGKQMAYFFPGEIGQINISNIARSDAWVKASNLSNTNCLIIPSFPIECSGSANTSSTTVSGALVRLYRFSDGKLVEETYTDLDGNFQMASLYDEPHYAVAFHPTASYNALIYSYLTPTLSGV